MGDFTDQRDEGLKNIAHSIAEWLSLNSDITVLKIDVKRLRIYTALKSLRTFQPEIVHYVPGPTNRSLLFLMIVRAFAGRSFKLVLSSPHPMFYDFVLRILRIRPDHVLCQSVAIQERMKRHGIQTTIITNGVDVTRFRPVDHETKSQLRKTFGLDESSFTVLHVGHLMKQRNLAVLEKVAAKYQVIVVGSQRIRTECDLLERLRNAGCIVMVGYQPRIQELYQLSDSYVFPVKKEFTITTPLSVLEAMACNLKVVTSRCDGIESLFSEGNGLTFAETDDEILEAIEAIHSGDVVASTKQMVESHTWKNVCQGIENVYRRLLAQNGRS